jgi:hypothetical protein
VTVVISKNGLPCPRCGRPMEVREHSSISAKQLDKRYYYRCWFYCTYPDCRTCQVMRHEDRVWNLDQDRRLNAIKQQLSGGDLPLTRSGKQRLRQKSLDTKKDSLSFNHLVRLSRDGNPRERRIRSVRRRRSDLK